MGEILWPAAIAYGFWRFAQVAELFAPVPASAKAPAKIVVPDDILAWASQQSESWAQDEQVQVAREKYVALGEDWNRVRSALGIGVMP